MNLADLLTPSCALFLDFDGSLVDIAPAPEDVIVPSRLVATLSSLHERLGGAVAVISGRPMSQIDEFLAPLKLPAAGVHGAERRSADGVVRLLMTSPLEDVENAALTLAARHPALRVENKRGSLALHFRQAPDLEALCVQAMQAAVDRTPGLTLLRGKMVVEAKPSGATKGHAIEAFMREAPFAGRRPVFAGDDTTDEAGFAVVQQLGGVGVKVGSGETLARERLASPAVLREQLEGAAARVHA
ncbi:trehalose-phosphatase [Caenimonas aquaedulcis]|uniref:Trehalose 6-phosphate phosphatase n=1 Tax=Caenimonas aquaedulcis TaxID=2793270 RepID=A0A931MHB6_9BURK|nr:trehalose-phosphatase [Caenimonas aquaedulcis]MBG9388802.1 trehalose-phosphatase [Caenimonas aquaedulcis]